MPEGTTGSGESSKRPTSRPIVALTGSAAAVAIAMVAGDRLTAILPPAYVVSVFLVAVLVAAAVFGLWAGLFAAVTSFFVFDFFFVEPTFTFDVADPREVFALGVFLVAAVLTGGLAGRLRETADDARSRADTLAMLRDFAERVSTTADADEIRRLVARQVATAAGCTTFVVDPRRPIDGAVASWPAPVTPSDEERRIIRHMIETAGSEPVLSPSFEFRPLIAADGLVAVIGLDRKVAVATGFDRIPGLAALLDQAAVALERARLATDRATATATAERERLRSALLSSISHDLRTPLATILGSVTSLRQLGDRMEPEDRADLLAAIEEETDRLSRLVTDLLAMTRLEAGLDVLRDWIDVDDAAAAAADHLRRIRPDHPVHLVRSGASIMVRGDATLLEQVVFNLGSNAVEASPAGAPIEIAVRHDGDSVVVVLTDRGRGLSGDDVRRLFEAPGETQAQPVPGSRGGLGLAIAHRVIGAMGGTLVAESRSTAVPGTRVTVRLPLRLEPGSVETKEVGEA